MSVTTYLANKALDAIFKNEVAGFIYLYVSLHEGDPGITGADEIVAGVCTYARLQTSPGSWDSAGSGTTKNAQLMTWLNLPAAEVSYVGIWDAISGGNFLWKGLLDAPISVTAGDMLKFSAGEIEVDLTLT